MGPYTKDPCFSFYQLFKRPSKKCCALRGVPPLRQGSGSAKKTLSSREQTKTSPSGPCAVYSFGEAQRDPHVSF